MTLTVRLKITIVLADGYIMGDRIGIFSPSNTLRMAATSPTYVLGSTVLNPGTYSFWVGYVACPGGFPAGYFIWIIATHA
jgi:hypothetical protein